MSKNSEIFNQLIAGLAPLNKKSPDELEAKLQALLEVYCSEDKKTDSDLQEAIYASEWWTTSLPLLLAKEIPGALDLCAYLDDDQLVGLVAEVCDWDADLAQELAGMIGDGQLYEDAMALIEEEEEPKDDI